ncbi:hypothetical protein CY0110_16252 [Crocosphaera chwakensis CCY0110]|uniref:Uncharacterized protein n=1 Tax=Crocosphaera chwakensis CCY0110 TaxID=391612 RepID=A3IHT2_9CHRO|nr:hypothetical protein CY0110_16252 [Crocosphaera chwakensis CCY0110]
MAKAAPKSRILIFPNRRPLESNSFINILQFV